MKKNFVAQTHQEGPKIICRHECFFSWICIKTLRKNSHIFITQYDLNWRKIFFEKKTLLLKLIRKVPKSFLDMNVFFRGKCIKTLRNFSDILWGKNPGKNKKTKLENFFREHLVGCNLSNSKPFDEKIWKSYYFGSVFIPGGAIFGEKFTGPL